MMKNFRKELHRIFNEKWTLNEKFEAIDELHDSIVRSDEQKKDVKEEQKKKIKKKD